MTKKDQTAKKLEDALEMAKRLKEQTQTPGEKKGINNDNADTAKDTNDQKAKNDTYTGPIDEKKFYAGPVNAMAKLYRKHENKLANVFAIAALPFTHILFPLAKGYMQFFNWAAKRKNPETGKMRYSFNGVASALGTTLLMLAFLRVGIPAAYDTGIALTTDKTEDLYIVNSSVIEDGEVFSVQACRELPCNPENSIYFHIEQDWGYPHFNLFPEELAGGIPDEVSWGPVTHNGIRIKTPLFRKYREVKDYDLTPLNELPANHPARQGLSQDIIQNVAPPPAPTQ